MNAAQNEAERKTLRHSPARDARRHPRQVNAAKNLGRESSIRPGGRLKKEKENVPLFFYETLLGTKAVIQKPV